MIYEIKIAYLVVDLLEYSKVMGRAPLARPFPRESHFERTNCPNILCAVLLLSGSIWNDFFCWKHDMDLSSINDIDIIYEPWAVLHVLQNLSWNLVKRRELNYLLCKSYSGILAQCESAHSPSRPNVERHLAKES